jgi:hypothetical protein
MFSTSAQARQDERRGEERRRMLKGGTLSFNKGYGALECVVRNLSAHGARLSFGDGSAVPPHFSLRVGPDGAWRQAEVRWRTMTEVGVALA